MSMALEESLDWIATESNLDEVEDQIQNVKKFIVNHRNYQVHLSNFFRKRKAKLISFKTVTMRISGGLIFHRSANMPGNRELINTKS